jgi:hypothetical protein
MPSYKNTVAANFLSAVKQFQSSPLAKLMGLTETKSEDLPLDNPHIWTRAARTAHTLGNAAPDAALRKAFAEFRLDPRNPLDWRTLATYLAIMLFSERTRGGRPAEWNYRRYCELLGAVHRLKQSNTRLSDKRACELIAADRHSPEYFRKAKAEGLRKALRKARSVKNEMVRKLVEDVTPGLKEMAEKEGLEWSQVENGFIAATEKKVAEIISSDWGRGDKTLRHDSSQISRQKI